MVEQQSVGRRLGRGKAWLLIAGLVALGARPAGAAEKFAQYGARVWHADDGLPQNCVQAVVQTHDGYLWVGTQFGAARFDGVRFTVFNRANVPEFLNANIIGMLESRDGSLWLSTGYGGIVRLKDGKFSHFGKSDGLADDVGLGSMLETRDGSLWFGTLRGLSRYRDGKFTTFGKKTGLGSDVVRGLCEDREGRLWLGAPDGVYCWKDEVVQRRFTAGDGLRNNDVRSVCCDCDGSIWVGAGDGVSHIHGDKVTTYGPNDKLRYNIVTKVFQDSAGTLWVGSYGGLSRLTDGKLVTQMDDGDQAFDTVSAIFEDREGNIWVGSRDGLSQLKGKRFICYTQQNGLSCNNVISVMEGSDGTIWAGTWGGGVNSFRDGTFSSATVTDGPVPTLVLGMLQDRDGSLWAGEDWSGGLYHLQGDHFERFGPGQGLPLDAVRVIHQDGNGTIWVGTSRGLYRRKGGRKFELLRTKDGMPNEVVREVCEDRKGDLWVASNGALRRIHDGQITRFSTTNGLSADPIGAVYADAQDNLWVGTSGSGLYRFRDGKFTSYSTRQGLFSDNVFDILEDDNGWLWMTSLRGIFRVNKHELDDLDRGTLDRIKSISYGKADGLVSETCSMVAKPGAWKARDGRLWFATTRGLCVIDPRQEGNEIRSIPAVILERVIADNRAFPAEDSLPLGGTVRIPPGHGELEFHYTALSFRTPERNRFKFRLEGVDNDWVSAGPRRAAYYKNVAPGHYRFRVQGCGNDGVWNEAGASADIVLLPHFWQTWWLKGAVGVAVILAFAGIHVIRMAQVREIERLRLRIAADLHDDVGSHLSTISLLSRKLQKAGGSGPEAEGDVAAIRRLSMQAANAIREIVWLINPEYDTLQDLAARMEDAARSLLPGILCRFEKRQEHYAWRLPLHQRQNLFLLFKEILTNVAKHSGATEVQILVVERHHHWELCVQDNGVGFEPEAAHAGNGLKNLRQRATRLQGQLRIESKLGAGSKVTFSMTMT